MTNEVLEPNKEAKTSLASFVKRIGPGVVTGAADDDPSGIITYTAAGSAFGFGFLWTALLTYPLMCAVEYVSAKIALVTGEGLAGVLKEHYGPQLVYAALAILLIANTINAGTDIGAVAAAINLLVPQLSIHWLIVPVGLTVIGLQVLCSYKSLRRVLQWLTISLLAYVGTVFFVKIDWSSVIYNTLVPHLSLTKDCVAMLVAILGTTISPYCLFWQATEEVEEERALGRFERSQRLGATDKELRGAIDDIDFGMMLCIGVMYSIMLTSACAIDSAHGVQIKTAADAARALRPMAGPAAELLFALGIIGTGLLAIPVLTASAAYALSEALGWEATLDTKPSQGFGFYTVIIASIIIGITLVELGINPISALVWTAVLNGVLAPPLLILLMLIANNRKIMGDRVNSLGENILGWSAAGVMTVAAVVLFTMML